MLSKSPSQIFGIALDAPLIPAVICHALLWSLAVSLILGNLHTDSLEAAYWGHEWLWGYSKHPPLTSWLMDASLQWDGWIGAYIGHAPIFALMALSQITVLMTSFFIWKLTRLYASRQTAGLAVMLFILSPAASFYAVQLNHNSMLAPFCAATLYFGLAYMEEQGWMEAIALGLSVGLGAITKYEIAFAVVPLLVLALLVPRFRRVFYQPHSYVAVAISLMIFAPHVFFLASHHWSSVSRAVGTLKIDSLDRFNLSVVNALIGAFALCSVPSILLLATQKWRSADDDLRRPDRELIAGVILFGPILALLVLSFATWQVIKPLWVLPLSASTAIGLALFFPAGAFGIGLSETRIARLIFYVSQIIFAGFVIYLAIAAGIGRPLTAYSVNGQKLDQSVRELWSHYQSGPLACVIINERKIGPSVYLWEDGRPIVLDMTSPEWLASDERQSCLKGGAVAILAEPIDDPHLLEAIPYACMADARRMDVRPKYLSTKGVWPLTLVYVPAQEQPSCQPG